jgi:drug/metabolite transporter (DMT)-like permease
MPLLPGLGESAALATSLCWALCSRSFAGAGLRIGSVAVNHLRLLGGVVLLTAMHAGLLGSPLPSGVPGRTALLFVASGIVGLTLGDAALFHAWVLVGPARGVLVMTTAPVWAALLARAFLGESLGAPAVTGIGVTVGGVALAVSGRAPWGVSGGRAREGREVAAGLGLAALGALGQAGGVVLAKPALAEVPALSGTWIRMLAAAAALWLATGLRCLIRGRRPTWWDAARRDRRGLGLTLAGTITGPALGVWLSLVATKHASVGVAATLMAVTPLHVLGIDWLLDGRRPRRREVAGGLLAVAGVALLVAATG